MSRKILGFDVWRHGPSPRRPLARHLFREPGIYDLLHATPPMSYPAMLVWAIIGRWPAYPWNLFPLQPVDTIEGVCHLGGVAIAPGRFVITNNEVFMTDGTQTDVAAVIAFAESKRVSDAPTMVQVYQRCDDNGKELERITWFGPTDRIQGHYAHTTVTDVTFYTAEGEQIGRALPRRADRKEAS